MSKKKRHKGHAFDAQGQLLPPQDPAPVPFPRWIIVSALSAFALCVLICVNVARQVTLLHYDSFVYLFGAENILGWEGTWNNVNAHPFVTWFYSRLLLFTQRFGSMTRELRWACMTNCAIWMTSLAIGVVWLKKVFRDDPLKWLLAVLFMVGNSMVLENAGWPLGELMSTGLGTLGMLCVYRGVRGDSWLFRFLGASLFGVCVLTKYQTWIFAPVAMLFDYLNTPHLPRPKRLLRLIPYPLMGAAVVISSMAALWHFYPPVHEQRLGVIFKEFVEYYREKSLHGTEYQPFWVYLTAFREAYGWPALAAYGAGIFAGFAGSRLQRLSTLWSVTYLISIMFLYDLKTVKYVLSALVPFSAVVSMGMLALGGGVAAFFSVRRGVGIAAVAALCLGHAAVLSVEKYASVTASCFTRPELITMGDWIRRKMGDTGALIQTWSGSSWATFIAKKIPGAVQVARWDLDGAHAVPIDVLPYLKTRDVVIMGPRRNVHELYLGAADVQDFPLRGMGQGRVLFAKDESRAVWMIEERPGEWRLEPRARPGQGWAVFLEERAFGVSRREKTFPLAKEDLPKLRGLKLVTMETKYYPLGGDVNFPVF